MKMRPSSKIFLILSVVILVVLHNVFAQIDAPLIPLKRGMLWELFHYGKVCAPFSNWSRLNIGMDWPGFDPEWIGADIGGQASHLTTGGFWIGARDSTDRVISIDDWAMYTGNVSPELNAKYTSKKHTKRWKSGENYWCQLDPNEAEEVIDSEWEMNPTYQPQYGGERQLPLNVRRTVRQWNGSQKDENYIIIEYVLKNISGKVKGNIIPDTMTMYGTYLMFTYAFSINARGWRVLFPSYSAGSRNNRFIFDPTRRLIYGWAIDFPVTAGVDETYDFYPQGGPDRKGEFLAPGYPGLKFLYISPDSTGRTNRINGYAWAVADDRIDLYGPFIGITGYATEYEILKDPKKNSYPVTSPSAAEWGNRRMWSLISVGPFTLKPGDSIKVVTAEVIGGISYADAINPQTTKAKIGSEGTKALFANADRAQFAYDHDYRLTHPPAAPKFTVRLYDEKEGIVADVIEWGKEAESIPDPDYTGDERYDLAGYRIYRSNYLPIGPWERIADIKKGDPTVFNSATGKYKYVDTSVSIGSSYYYAVTAYDTGHISWPVDRAYRFPETGSNKVPPMESSIFANRTTTAFRATIPATKRMSRILVVPNPFVARSGLINPGDIDVISFVNIPSPCTIRIYTMRGDLVKTIEHNDGSGIAAWNQVTDYGQFAKSGIYIYHIETPDGDKAIGKFAIIR